VLYDTKLDGKDLLVTLQPAQSAAAASGTTAKFAEGKSGAQHSLRDIDFRRGSNGEGRIVVDL
jgi:type IV pilus assembly protein PilQ